MEVIVINENKLKITMSKTDMINYGLDENEFHCSVINAREILEKILHNTPIKTGFENISPEDKILIQLYPEKHGGCELYVTKITLEEKEGTIFMPQENEDKYLLPKPIQKKQIAKNSLISYRSECLEHSIDASKELILRNFVGESSFYQNSDGKYYLLINAKSSINADIHSQIDFLSDFGELTNTENSFLLLSEYGKCIFSRNAIESLSEI